MKRLAHFVKPHSNELLMIGHVKEICILERVWSHFNLSGAGMMFASVLCASLSVGEMGLMIYTALLVQLILRGAVVVRGALPSRPLFHLQPLSCKMETWHSKSRIGVSPLYPP